MAGGLHSEESDWQETDLGGGSTLEAEAGLFQIQENNLGLTVSLGRPN